MFVLVDYILDTFKRSLRYQRTIAELNNLSDRDLRDLGINRYDIEYVARKSVYHELV